MFHKQEGGALFLFFVLGIEKKIATGRTLCTSHTLIEDISTVIELLLVMLLYCYVVYMCILTSVCR